MPLNLNNMEKFITVKKNGVENINKWFAHCQNHQIPFITIIERNKYCKISWDCISFDKPYDKTFEQNDEFLFKAFLNTFDKYSNKKSKYEYSCLLLTFDNILITDSLNLAEEVFDILNYVVKKNNTLKENRQKRVGVL